MYTSFSLLRVITTGIPSQYFPIPFISFENPKQPIPNSGAPEEFRTHFKNSWWRLGQCSDCSKRRIVLILSEKHWKTLQAALRSLKDRLTAGKAVRDVEMYHLLKNSCYACYAKWTRSQSSSWEEQFQAQCQLGRRLVCHLLWLWRRRWCRCPSV